MYEYFKYKEESSIRYNGNTDYCQQKWNFKFTPEFYYVKKTIRQFLAFRLFEQYNNYSYYEDIFEKEEKCPVCGISFLYMRISKRDHIHKNCGVTLTYHCKDTNLSHVYFATPYKKFGR